MSDFRILLDAVAIVSPCRVDWKDMVGSARVRTCSMCKLHVYNLSEMTTKEAEDLFSANSAGNLCLKLFRRNDGTIMTKDCSVARRIIDKSALRIRLLVAWLLSCFNVAPAIAQSQLDRISPIDRYGGFGVLESTVSRIGNSETQEMRERLRKYDGEGADTRALTYFNRALAYERFGKFSEALLAYDQALTIIRTKDFNGDPKFSQMVAARNIVLLVKRGDAKKAKELESEFCLDDKKIASLLKSEKTKAESMLQEENKLLDETITPGSAAIPGSEVKLTDGSGRKN
ncbi:tetratricopeptide repeat protein [bacterium]|nr:tetratricopeptide repeat protein [bacterium]MBP9810368.1 tetratricopeptide repeat protein [bacterium]